jgi:uroporphyrinogen-III decarboxylase
MTSRERMIAALEGREVDRIPVAPYFWGAEYSWKLVGKPIWEVLHGDGDMTLAVLEALDERHGCDWVIPLHGSSRALRGKTYSREDHSRVYFTEDSTGDEWVFHKEGHWLVRAEEVGEARGDNLGAGTEPPRGKAEADDWLKRHFGHLEAPPPPHEPNRRLRERFPDRFLCSSVIAPFAGLAYVLGFEPTLMLLHDDPGLCAYLIERTMAHVPVHCANLATDGFDAGLMVDSWASADIMSPRTYRDWIAPLHKLVSDELHRAGLKSVMYNTGNVLPMLDTIAGLGYDAISVEERIKGIEMDIGEIRRAVGPDQCLFGNFDAYLLLAGERDAISREARRQIDSAGPGAFVMGTGSPVCDATEPDVIDYWIGEIRACR